MAPVDVLKIGFESAGPASVENFPRFVDLTQGQSKLKCQGVIYASDEKPQEASLTDMYVGSFNYTINTKTITTMSPVVMTDTPAKYKIDEDLIKAMKNLSIQFAETTHSENGDLEAIYPLGGMSLQMTYRKKDAELFVHETIGTPDSHAEIFASCAQ